MTRFRTGTVNPIAAVDCAMQFSSWRWNRIIAFLDDARLLFWVPWSRLSPVLPEWTMDMPWSIPLGLCAHGFTEQPRNVIAMVPAGTVLGVRILALYQAFGFGLF